MKTLRLVTIDTINTFASPRAQANITIQSPALSFFTDFEKTKPRVIDSDFTAIETKKLMIKAHVRLKLVINKKGEFVGLVSAEELSDRKIMQRVAEGELREEITVLDCMIPKSQLKALRFNDISACSIGDVINALQGSGQQHCLVVEQDEGVIRGLFSVSDISRKLQVDIDIQDSPSFLKLASSLD